MCMCSVFAELPCFSWEITKRRWSTSKKGMPWQVRQLEQLVKSLALHAVATIESQVFFAILM